MDIPGAIPPLLTLVCLIACSGEPTRAAPPDPDQGRFDVLGRFAPEPPVQAEIHDAYLVSQGLDCALLRAAADRAGGAEALEGGCEGDVLPLAELAARACAELPPGYDLPPSLDELDLLAMAQLDAWGHAYPLEAVARTRAALEGDGWESAALQHSRFQQVRQAINTWQPDAALACAALGEEDSRAAGMDLLAAQFIESEAFALVKAQAYDDSKAAFRVARAAYAAVEDPYYTRRLEGNHSAMHDRREQRQEEARWGAEQALEAFIATGDVQRSGRALIKQAMNAFYDGELDQAEELARAAVSFGRSTHEPAIEGEALIALGHGMAERGDFHGASDAYRDAMGRFSPQGPGRLNWLNAFSALIEMGLRTLMDSPGGAERDRLLEELDGKVTRAEVFLADLSPEQWVELKLNHGRIKLELGRVAEARTLAELARDKVESDDLSIWEVPVMLLMGDVEAAAGERDAALAQYTQAERASQAAEDPTQAWTAMLGQAAVYQRAGERDAALDQLGRAAQLVERLWVKVAQATGRPGGAGSGSATFLESQIHLYDRAVETLLEGDPTPEDTLLAWWWLERRRSNELRLKLGREEGAEPMDASASRAAEWLAQVQARIAPAHGGRGATVLEYHLSRGAAWVFLIGHDRFLARPLPLSGDAVAEAVTAAFPFLDGRQGDAPVDPAGARALADALLGPVASELEAGQSLRIIPDGGLTLVPFDVLPWQGEPLIRAWPVAYDTSATALLASPGPQPSTARGLLSISVGDALPAEDDRGALPPLPCADTESRTLTVGPEDLSLRRSDATEDAFRESAPHFDILHIAAHGVVEEGSWRRSHLALHPGEVHDGRLSLQEIASLDLHARLAVLPACRSAVARIFRGEGIQGVGSAFRKAGVPSTVVGLWELPDVQGTTELVARMVAYVRRGLEQDEALRRAKLDVLAAGAGPRVWAPLVLYGATAPLVERPRAEATVQLPPPEGLMGAACRQRPLRDLLGDVAHDLGGLFD